MILTVGFFRVSDAPITARAHYSLTGACGWTANYMTYPLTRRYHELGGAMGNGLFQKILDWDLSMMNAASTLSTQILGVDGRLDCKDDANRRVDSGQQGFFMAMLYDTITRGLLEMSTVDTVVPKHQLTIELRASAYQRAS